MDDDLRPQTFAARLIRRVVGAATAPRETVLVRGLIVRLLGAIYACAFLGLVLQGPGLLGAHGVTPVARLVERLHAAGVTVLDVPSIFLLDASDRTLALAAYAGLALALACALGYANLPSLLALWLLYGSFERVGQLWFAFGWEIQLLETTLLVACLVAPLDPRLRRARPAHPAAIVLLRWLALRIFLGAGLIKLRGSPCWRDLTCLDVHFETQPLPNPLTPLFHDAPHAIHALGVVINHVVELVLPWLAFGPRRARLVAAAGMTGFQLILIASGNLSFLNWLTLIPSLALLDDDAVRALIPRRWRPAPTPPRPPPSLRPFFVALGLGIPIAALGEAASVPVALALGVLAAGVAVALVRPRAGLALGAFAAVVAVKSCVVVDNLASPHQAMNRAYDRFALVNTYGAFGSVDDVRHELILEGTADPDPAHATWRAYELPCKPGALDRAPCVLGPYHRRFDWLIWFAAMVPPDETAWRGPTWNEPDRTVWVLHVAYKLLQHDAAVRDLFAADPFAQAPPRYVRIRRFVYHLAGYRDATWWTRDTEELWLPPISLDDEWAIDLLARYGWPSG